MTIRGRLLWLTLGLLVPLVLIGFFNLRGFRQASRTQINESLERQAQFAATAFEQRILAQRRTLETISILANNNESRFALRAYLDSIVRTRPNWLDVQIVNAAGRVVLAQTNKNLNLQAVTVEFLKREVGRKNSFIISTEQSKDAKLRLLSLALPIANGNFVVARIDGASANEIFDNVKLPEESIIAVFDANNRLLYRSRVSSGQMSLDVGETMFLSALDGKQQATIEVESPYDKIGRVYGLARVESANYIVVVGVPSAILYESARQQFLRQLLFSLLMTLVAVVAAFIIARSIIRPMQLLTGAARAFGAGDLSVRTEITGSSAISELGQTFNQMAEQITRREEELKALDRLKSEFVSSVSHELRTPLTTIKTLTRVLQSDKISASERAEFLETIAFECDRQIDFVQNLLDLSRIEAGAYKISPARTDTVGLLRECVEAQQRTADSRRLQLKFKLPPEDLPPAVTDAGALRRIVSSLIENAIKYTPENGKIEVSAENRNEKIAVTVTDTGCGIAAADISRVFERFYRGRPLEKNAGENGKQSEDSLNNETSGVGLGLFLADSLVEQIGGEIIVQSPVGENGRGTKFTVFLPTM